MSNPTEWHIQAAGKRSGAKSAVDVKQQLLSGNLVPADLAWRQGMHDWAPLSSIAEFGGKPLPPLPDDPGPFRKIGTTFYLNGQEWVGKTIVSPIALYLLKNRSLQGVHVSHNLVTSLLNTAVGLHSQINPNVRTCKLAELRAGVRAQLDPKGKCAAGSVVVAVLKAAVQSVNVAKFNNVITLMSEGRQIRVVTSWFGVRKVGRWLAEQGWTLNP